MDRYEPAEYKMTNGKEVVLVSEDEAEELMKQGWWEVKSWSWDYFLYTK